VSIQDIRQNPQDISNFYLENTYKATINPNLSSSLPTSPPSFSPPHWAVCVNSLWFLSLVISLTCALLATFLQQWARRYLKLTQTRYKPHKRARIRAFYFEGVDKCLLSWVVETLPTLLHISLFLFFAGLVVFLSNVNLTIFKVVLSWVAICAALYGCLTLMPIIRHDSPYCTSLSSSVWSIVMGVAFYASAVGDLLYRMVSGCHEARWLSEFVDRCGHMLFDGMQKTAEETALKSPSGIDTRAFIWTFEILDEDHELERFFAGLSGFRSSHVVKDPLPDLGYFEMDHLQRACYGLLRRTLASDLLPESVKKRRAVTLAKALDPKHFPYAFLYLEDILSTFRYDGPPATGVADILRGWRNQARDNGDEETVREAQGIISHILAWREPRDDSWFTLASNELGVPESVLRDHAANGDSLSLAILIHIVRQQFDHLRNGFWLVLKFSDVLKVVSHIKVQGTKPELQHKFCALWNEILREGQNNEEMTSLLAPIRDTYIALHKDTDSAPTQFSAFTYDEARILKDPSSYPFCDEPDHHPDWTPHIRSRFDHTFSSPESRSSMLLPTSHRSSLSSAGDSGATSMREDSEKVALRKGKETYVPFPAPAIPENVFVTMNVPSRSPSP
jgi:hypothetical protein